jgi:hypothetical protein
MTNDQMAAIRDLIDLGSCLVVRIEAAGMDAAGESSRRWADATAKWSAVAGQKKCAVRRCNNAADGSGIMCPQCWIDTGDREVTT